MQQSPEAGRRLFAVSRSAKTTTNDTDRLAKYLRRFVIRFADILRANAARA